MSIARFFKFALGLLPIVSSVQAHSESVCEMQTVLPDSTEVSVCALTDNIIKVSYSRPGQQSIATGSSVIKRQNAASAIYNLGNGTAGNSLALATMGGPRAVLDKTTGEVTIDGGADKIVSCAGVQASDGKQTLKLYTTSQGSYYGAGERGHKINLRGDTLVMYNRQNYGYTKGDPRISQMNITMPLFISSDGFAILFDDYAAAEMHLGENSTITYTTESPYALSFYYINGRSTIADVVAELSSLTGRQPLPPLWSLGYITSKYGYRNEKETIGAIDTLKTQGYPVDGIVLDLYWYGKEEDMGRLAWDPEQWPNAKKMLADLKKENVNLIAISQPYVLRNGKGIDNYNFLSQNGMLLADSTGLNPQEVVIWVGEGGMLDVSNARTASWLANRYKELTDMGVTGWWGDLGEPEVHPESGLHANGLPTRLYHNKYGNDWSKIVYDMFQKEYPDTRLVTMMRGGTTGLQRYSVFPWSTDVSRSWEGMQPQIAIMLNSGLSGLGYMGHDVGGFAVDKDNPIDPELYVRWMQLGLFSPMLRTHAQEYAEPYHYPQYSQILLDLVRQRYAWLPYNYTLAYENAAYGYPLVRPLNFFEAGSNAYDDIDDEYLWGPEVLVAPVMQQGATSRQVVFPQGQWIDFNNPLSVYEGGDTIEYPAPLPVLPLFAKAGAFIPMASGKMESTADYNPGKIDVRYYPATGVASQFTMYDDDKLSASAIEKGQYRLITFTGDAKADGQISISISSQGGYEGAPSQVDMRMAVCGISSLPASVTVNGKKAKVKIADGCQLVFDVKFIPGQETDITIQP